ncbi:DUF58 domain-containing protein [Aeoliella sp. ICT_H6.2]|uniref:DUF58 domain-containing protein n=1 Tax=Aeoliella straminimaris TaxID=2954799 RepID=A0A9X2JKI3_9BACT|nr:DUF58 domain-containing protein [Aeoliella straminimaris]MCO6046604.1 DUF58 domain-containing protein [Aeoliella straminimaris]
MDGRVTTTLEELILLKADARGFSFSPRQPVGSLLSGRHASRLRGRGLSFEELRQYREGDDIRTMDWKATARLRSPQVRVYTEERERPVLLVVDQRQTMFFGSQRAMKSVAAAELAALGAWRALDAGDRVGGLVLGDNEIVEIRPHRSQTRVLQLLHEVVRLNEQLVTAHSHDNSATLNQALTQAFQVAKHDHLVVLVSDLDGADEETSRLAARIAAHNDMLVAAVYDPLGASLVGSPGMLASDRGRTWEVAGGGNFTQDFRSAFQQRLDEWREIFRALRVPVLPISAARAVPEQIRALFGNRPQKA